jgi:tRNA threonylcarbamoyladenosine biosynthesis protein TsaB
VLIAGIDTATIQVSVAIGGHEGVLASTRSCRARQHAEVLTPAIEFTCRQARIELSEISVVAVDLGPGMFTGLRVGIAAGKALAHARRLPMIGVSSLDLLAFAPRFTRRRIVGAIDAGRGEIFHASYRQSPGGVQRLTDARVGPAEELASELAAVNDELLLVGDGAIRYRAAFEDLHRLEIGDSGVAHPSAGSLVLLAHERALREEFVSPTELTPLYLRKPDAEIGWTTREGVR